MKKKSSRQSVAPKTKSSVSIPRPKPWPHDKAAITVHGDELIEAMFFAENKADILLLRAKQAAKYARASHLSNSELRAVSWFAHLPGVSGDLSQVIYNEGNFLVSRFWSVWRREPEAVLRLAARILNPARDNTDVEDVISNPKKFSASSNSTLKKAVQRARRKMAPKENVSKFAARLQGARGQKQP